MNWNCQQTATLTRAFDNGGAVGLYSDVTDPTHTNDIDPTRANDIDPTRAIVTPNHPVEPAPVAGAPAAPSVSTGPAPVAEVPASDGIHPLARRDAGQRHCCHQGTALAYAGHII